MRVILHSVKEVVRQQEQAGLRGISDGEFRVGWPRERCVPDRVHTAKSTVLVSFVARVLPLGFFEARRR